MPSDWVSLNQMGERPEDTWSLVVPPVAEKLHELFARYGHQNPLVRRALATRDGRAYRFSDVISREELHALDLYREVYAPLGLEHQLAFILPYEPPRLLGVALSRRREDFTDAERELINRVRPFLIQGYRNALEHAKLQVQPGVGALSRALRTAGLTPREADVVRLVALGRSNEDAGKALALSVRTIHKHLEHAFPKLGVSKRSEAAAIAWSLAEREASASLIGR